MTSMKIRRALISVWDKTGIVDFARALHDEFGVEIISTGGTAKKLTEAGIPVTLVETLTGCGEMLDGRVKTLHPAIHAAILADRGNPEHMRQLEAAGIKPIDLVVVNLYPFEKTVADPNCTFEQAIEMIDIGGVALLRAAAKNERHVLTIWTPDEYGPAIAMFRQPAAGLPLPGHCLAGFGAFFITSGYDASIAEWQAKAANTWPHPHFLALKDWGGVRYGENSHQMARLLANRAAPELELIHATCGEGIDEQERMSFNNFVDADAALGLCAELTRAGNRLMRQGSALEVSPAPSTPPKTETGARSEVWNRPMAGFPSAQPEDPAHSKNAPAPKNSTPPKPGFASARKPITDERFSRRNLPHIQRPGASYFITFRTAPEQGISPTASCSASTPQSACRIMFTCCSRRWRRAPDSGGR
ncbi:MAG: hypothetical protein HZB38_03245 [Planctomycetes bacterium]|nr:hypothetical protein [Planctomycetota bacterium]